MKIVSGECPLVAGILNENEKKENIYWNGGVGLGGTVPSPGRASHSDGYSPC